MKKILFLLIFLHYSLSIRAQEVTTLAGSINGFVDGTTGTPAQFYSPNAVATDAVGNVYVADRMNNKIRKITPNGFVSTLAGSTSGFADGVGTGAKFNNPYGVTTDASGNVYVADTDNNKIRKITPNGTVSTLAGTTQGFTNGTGTVAQFNNPHGVATDLNGNVYVADLGNDKIRKITPNGDVTTFAGTTDGYLDGAGTVAEFTTPIAVATDKNGNVYVVDYSKVRKITPSGVVTTLAGSISGFAEGVGTVAKFWQPNGISTDLNGNVYVADTGNKKIRKITPSGDVTTFAGTTQGFTDGAGTVAKFYTPSGVTTDASGNVYVADTNNNKIRKIIPSGVVSTIAGTTSGFADGTAIPAQFNNPYSVATDNNGNIYVADSDNNSIRKISSNGIVSTLAGSTKGYLDGTGSTAKFDKPCGIATDTNGNVYVADTNNYKIRKITPNGIVTTLAGSTMGYLDGTGNIAQFNSPNGIATDAGGNVYIGDTGNNRIRKITPSGVVTTFAGSTAGYLDSTGTTAKFFSPYGITTDASGNVYVGDIDNYKIRKITPSGIVTTLAGSTMGNLDGSASTAQFYYISGITIDANKNVYIADMYTNTIRKITPNGEVTTFAGSTLGYLDSTGISAQFFQPRGIATNANGNIYIADTGNNKIRIISQTLGLNKYNPSNTILKLYPNPTYGLLNVDVEAFSSSSQIQITNIMGKIILSQKIESPKTTINTSTYSKGIYFLTVFDNKKKETQKFIVD